MHIRPAKSDEGAVCDELLTRLIQTERQWEPNLNEDFVVTNNYEHRTAEDGTLLLVAEENSKIVGFLFGFLSPSPVLKQPTALLDALFVCEGHRSKGIGKALALRFREWVKEQGVYAIELKVMSQNTTALRLYESLGFSETKKYMQCNL